MLKDQFANILKFRWSLQLLVRRALQTKYSCSFFDYIGSLLKLLLMTLVISVVFSYIFRSDIAGFPLYLLIGQILFTFFLRLQALPCFQSVQMVAFQSPRGSRPIF